MDKNLFCSLSYALSYLGYDEATFKNWVDYYQIPVYLKLNDTSAENEFTYTGFVISGLDTSDDFVSFTAGESIFSCGSLLPKEKIIDKYPIASIAQVIIGIPNGYWRIINDNSNWLSPSDGDTLTLNTHQPSSSYDMRLWYQVGSAANPAYIPYIQLSDLHNPPVESVRAKKNKEIESCTKTHGNSLKNDDKRAETIAFAEAVREKHPERCSKSAQEWANAVEDEALRAYSDHRPLHKGESLLKLLRKHKNKRDLFIGL